MEKKNELKKIYKAKYLKKYHLIDEDNVSGNYHKNKDMSRLNKNMCKNAVPKVNTVKKKTKKWWKIANSLSLFFCMNIE